MVCLVYVAECTTMLSYSEIKPLAVLFVRSIFVNFFFAIYSLSLPDACESIRSSIHVVLCVALD